MRQRHGTVMLALLVVVLIGGVLAIRLVPSYEIQERRQSDQELRFSLAQIRQAVDMKSFLDPTWPPATMNLGIASEVKDLLIGLQKENLLGDIPRDTTIVSYQWAQNMSASPTEGHFWVFSSNIASNTNFEDEEGGTLASWTVGPETFLATEQIAFPAALDDYKGQNKFGRLFSTNNTTIKIVK
ncbi:MAG: hypothetical protein OZSIB_1143 [Candidatus Ozemobacter sibiricus]|jgi:type II secretory pathway pseudopilin PulG|uniref:Uncharacterized protein n=1 Tax=Candidatus Ozemobacter sibiricus TaxID=2268124 RepID=A0A367ZL69_9BACT|nr:MAG: hypothetical protein OZSIB_1143 [Candidatus Ozemobacter sibiricus]